LRVLQVISWGYLAGGAEKSVDMIKSNLRAKGHNVAILSSDHNGLYKHFSDIEFEEIDKSGRSLARKLAYHLWYPRSYKSIKQAVKDFQPDVVHFHTMSQLSPSAIYAVGKVPGILTVHGPEEYVASILEWSFSPKLFRRNEVNLKNLNLVGMLHYVYYRFIQRPIYKNVFRKKIKLLIAPSQYMAAVLEKESLGVPIQQIYNGIELPKPSPINNSNQLLYVGRLERVKGVHILLKAMQSVLFKNPQTKLNIIGDGSARAELEAYANTNGLKDSVKFLGWHSDQEIIRDYIDASIVVIPSIWPENLPTVCIEALAVGRPVIGTRTGGIPELIKENVTGLIVKPHDQSELATSIIALMNSKKLKQMSRAAISSTKKFDIERFIEDLLSVYSYVAEENIESKNVK
jgi:glycosyltransferase involved in cell wall biosynthesis